MKVKQIIEIVNGKFLVLSHDLDYDVDTACGADLMSDVMAFYEGNSVLITGLVNLQVIRTAEMMDIKVIVFVRGKKPNSQMISLANELGITIIITNDLMYVTCGKLYSNGLLGGSSK